MKYSFKIEKEIDLLERIDKMISIKNDDKNKELMIRYLDNGKRTKVTKKYKTISIDEAMVFMKDKQKGLRTTLSICI